MNISLILYSKRWNYLFQFLLKKQNAKKKIFLQVFVGCVRAAHQTNQIQPNTKEQLLTKQRFCKTNNEINRRLNDYSQVFTVDDVQFGQNTMSTNITFVVLKNSDKTDDEFEKIQMDNFNKIEKKRKKKHHNEIVKIMDLPFGLWQCVSCGTVNSVKNFPCCVTCKKFFR